MTNAQAVVRTSYERRSQTDWDNKTHDPINLLLSEEDGLYHHHFAVGGFDQSVLETPEADREAATPWLVPSTVWDLTTEAIPYWQLRSHSDHRTGVEQPFLDGHQSGELNYLVIVADAVR